MAIHFLACHQYAPSLAFDLLQKRGTADINRMKKACFVNLLEKIEKLGEKVEQITTDRHPQIRKYMREKRKDIIYQFDVWWHVAKSIFKKLLKIAKKKVSSNLMPWIASIRNHFWWCCATCKGDVDLLKEKWTSIIHHIKNKHHWDSWTKFHKCEHDEIDEKAWLKEGSPAYTGLQKIVFEKKLLTDFNHLNRFSHPGNLEVYHAIVNKYAPKQQHFSYLGMICRTQLAALDHNSGVPQAKTKEGVLRYRLAFPKQAVKWVPKMNKIKKKTRRT